jgi:hypothetical protein
MTFGLICSLVLVSSASSSTTRAAAAARPNILIVVTGDQRGGLDVMPKTIAWMGTAGTRYANAFASTPLCCPSRASIFAGRYAHNHGVTSNRRAKTLDQQTTIQLPRSGGVSDGIFGKYLNSWLRQRPPYFDTRVTYGSSKTAYLGGDWNLQGTIETVSQ